MNKERWMWLMTGLAIGAVVVMLTVRSPKYAYAGNDRFEDYIMCTGPVTVLPNFQTDGIWLLDYRGGRLLGTVIDRNQGKILSWAEVDLVQEFNVQPKDKVHFMMTASTPWARATTNNPAWPSAATT
jgi:hypothetical protein